jgi:hypothetical protein
MRHKEVPATHLHKIMLEELQAVVTLMVPSDTICEPRGVHPIFRKAPDQLGLGSVCNYQPHQLALGSV